MKLKYFSMLALVIVLSFAGCKKLDEFNANPNEPSKTGTSYLLTGAEKQLMDCVWDQWMNGRFGMLYAQYWAQNQYTDESRYKLRTGTYNSYWALWYTGAGFVSGSNIAGGGTQALQNIIDLCTASPDEYKVYGDPTNQIAVARTLKAWMFQIITDTYGDVPYSEAFGDAVYPKYDKQEDIYTDLLKELKEAAAQMDASKGTIKGDLIYGGNIDKWKKFAHSLRLRVAMRMSDKNWAVSKAAIEESAPLAFAANSDNALMPYLGSTPNNNPLNEDRKTRADFASCKTMVDTMLSLTDPRLPMYAAPTVNGGTFVGKAYGLTQAAATAENPNTISQPSAKVLAATAPGVYMDYAEVCFIMAEAAERGASITGTAEEWYNNGIKASMEYWGVSSTDADAYVLLPGVAYTTAGGPAADWKHRIGFQKWLAMYMQGLQGWSEWRRLDFGLFKLPPSVNFFPTRMKYPIDEQTVNAKSYQEAVGRLSGGDALTSKVWWDAN